MRDGLRASIEISAEMLKFFFGGTGGVEGGLVGCVGRLLASSGDPGRDWKNEPPKPKPNLAWIGDTFVELANVSFNLEANEGDGDAFP